MPKKDNIKKNEEFISKNVAYYQTFLSAWIENRMEKDKQILLLSTLAIGLLISFSNNLNNLSQKILWILAGIPFIVAIFLALSIFSKNSDYIESLIRNDYSNEYKELENKLSTLTKQSFIFFIIGVLITFLLVLVLMFNVDISIIFGKR